MSAQDPAQIDQTTDFMWKATAAVATLASGFVAEKVVALGWRLLVRAGATTSSSATATGKTSASPPT